MSDHTYPVFKAVPDATRRPGRLPYYEKTNPADVRSRASLRESDERPRCIWPACLELQAGQGNAENFAAYGASPMCVTHIYETWQIAEDAASSVAARDRSIRLCDALTRMMPSTVPGGDKITHAPANRHPGDIYYLEIDGQIKIGYSSNLPRRLKEYPPSTVLLAFHPGSRVDETSYHRLFAAHRAARREWYVDHPEIRQHIQWVVNRYGPPPELHLWQQPEQRPQHVSKRARSGGTFGR